MNTITTMAAMTATTAMASVRVSMVSPSGRDQLATLLRFASRWRKSPSPVRLAFVGLASGLLSVAGCLPTPVRTPEEGLRRDGAVHRGPFADAKLVFGVERHAGCNLPAREGSLCGEHYSTEVLSGVGAGGGSDGDRSGGGSSRMRSRTSRRTRYAYSSPVIFPSSRSRNGPLGTDGIEETLMRSPPSSRFSAPARRLRDFRWLRRGPRSRAAR